MDQVKEVRADVRDRRDSVVEVNFQEENFVFTRKRTASDPRRRNHATLTIMSGEISTQVDSKLRVGHIGRGFNCVDGAVRTHLFDDLKAVYIEEKGHSERLNYFRNHEEYVVEAASRVGINEVSSGLFSLCGEPRENFPFLSYVERLEGYQHYIMEVESTLYTLKAKMSSSSHASLFQDEDVLFLTRNPFTPETKRRYFTVFERYGTHYFKSCTFGCKAELRWSFPEKADKDALERVTSLHTYRNKLLENMELWKKQHFSQDFGKTEDERVPRGALEIRRLSNNFLLPEAERAKNADQVKFQLEEISNLFSGPTKAHVEQAIKVFMDEMKPKKSVEELKEEAIVGIYCLDYNRYVKVDAHGHLFADGLKLNSDCQFRVKKKNSRLALKSLRFKDKFLSKALITSIFHFHRLQFMGPHESFELSEDYLKACGNISGSSFIYISPDDKELHHNGDLKRKNRFVLVDAEARIATFGDDTEEPSFFADDYIEDELEVKIESILKNNNTTTKRPTKDAGTNMAKQIFKKLPIKEVGKSNSTSSIFIKDTILLPNIDELTRCMATYLHDLILKAKAEKIVGKYVEIFSEEKYPLTKAANSIVVPSIEAINHFLNTIFKVARLSAEAGIMCIIYMNRVLVKTQTVLTPDNWRRIVLSCLILASKVWEDQAVWNVDFIELFPTLAVKELNKIESQLLNFLEFSVGIKASEYVKVYFELREHSAMSVEERLSKPMDESDLKKLEVRTASSEKQYEKEMLRFHKSSSMDVPPSDRQLPQKGRGRGHPAKTGLGILS